MARGQRSSGFPALAAAALALQVMGCGADPIFGARVGHMTIPQGADDPKLSVEYWPYKEGSSLPPLGPGEESLVMADGSTGRRHLCIIPNITAYGASDDGEDGQGRVRHASRRVEEGDTRKTPEEILDAMRGMPCFYKMEGWWTYEFCYKDKIRQLHFEPEAENKLKITMEFVLGIYDAAASREAQLQHEAAFAALAPEQRSGKKRFHAQVYTGGTPCDLTSVPRKTEVRFFCEGDSGLQAQRQKGQEQQQQHQQQQQQQLQHASFMKSIKEAPTCEYEMHFISSLLCAHRSFRTVEPQVNVINCYELQGEEEGGGEAAGEGVADFAGEELPLLEDAELSSGSDSDPEGPLRSGSDEEGEGNQEVGEGEVEEKDEARVSPSEDDEEFFEEDMEVKELEEELVQL